MWKIVETVNFLVYPPRWGGYPPAVRFIMNVILFGRYSCLKMKKLKENTPVHQFETIHPTVWKCKYIVYILPPYETIWWSDNRGKSIWWNTGQHHSAVLTGCENNSTPPIGGCVTYQKKASWVCCHTIPCHDFLKFPKAEENSSTLVGEHLPLFAALQMVQVFLFGLTSLWCCVKSFIYDKIPHLPLQMAVGSAAAEAIKKVHGMNYTVGTSPNVLCKSARCFEEPH